ncbi:hypothetical protein kac65v162_gp206 [Nodularia phage vB_NspS-kac65v162]|jgi:hypothetical protein|uniref:Uncharacterized protein n=6 Tax=Ravarandavirus TaxID=2843444 RepID=A0A482MLS9_9CAUD|nr:hypothetical protein HWA92_gp182 [Nodularia phage vB_NpeS-2AV2]YP_009844809.1 hypothetical protein HWC12_gp111 [Nodularia phage vB_NspS-kac65v151]YP_009845007.1 hypothetical protein HWC13_gp113 [Nodularia phage vB_NspS-kac68v161]QBQ73444.1 hypothetical protein kac65v161_gp206 [Nodularia phage vB_NspS-kac65v161]QBQ73650.1 hypothetical protein kac65v162_gp206 [Nodularia phage vB_NspS-kac65v162]QBQ74043.1 hypothetical protein kac68v162_gp195 [Nodularia phage vB_NspS-kac68v162]ALY07634.1 hypot
MRKATKVCVDVDIDMVDYLQPLLKENTKSKTVHAALSILCKYDIETIKAGEFDQIHALQLPEQLKRRLCQVTGYTVWQAAAIEAITTFMDQKIAEQQGDKNNG